MKSLVKMNDQTIKCKQCGNMFVWSKEEQELYAKRGLPEPDYCPICRGIIGAQARDLNRAKYRRKENNK